MRGSRSPGRHSEGARVVAGGTCGVREWSYVGGGDAIDVSERRDLDFLGMVLRCILKRHEREALELRTCSERVDDRRIDVLLRLHTGHAVIDGILCIVN